MRNEQRGSAATLAVFTIFVILSGVVALNTFESGYTRQLSTLQQRMSVDTTKAVAAVIEVELDDSLAKAISAAIFESGKGAENKASVESRLRDYFNERIAAGWAYSNFENIYVPLSDENSLQIEWLPDGGLRAYGYLNASFKHVSGAKAYGVKLDAGVAPRYGRMIFLAYRIYYLNWPSDNELPAFEVGLNDNYAAERFSFHLWREGASKKLTLNELFGGRVVTTENAT